MAARYSKGRVIAAGSLAKRFTDRVLASNSRPPLFTGTVALCSSSSSSYDKNVDDEHVRPAVVPDHVIAPGSDKYWAPHPKTGVFGPAGSGTHRDAAADGGSPSSQAPSVMDQTAWFRPLEDVDKPPPSSLA